MTSKQLLRKFSLVLLSLMILSDAKGQWVSKDEQASNSPPTTYDELLHHYHTEAAPGAAIAIVENGAMTFSGEFGQSNLELSTPINRSTVFNAGSLAKQFTAYGIAQLVVDGTISLDDDVRLFLPEVANLDDPVLIRHLVHHTSGLKDQLGVLVLSGWRYTDTITSEDVLQMTSRLEELDQIPGSAHIYSNTNYSLLAQIVERVTDVPFPEWIDDTIFRPLEMHNTSIVSSPTQIIPGLADGYENTDPSSLEKQPIYWYEVGPGSLYSTAEDLAKWIAQLMSSPSRPPMTKPAACKSGQPRLLARAEKKCGSRTEVWSRSMTHWCGGSDRRWWKRYRSAPTGFGRTS